MSKPKFKIMDVMGALLEKTGIETFEEKSSFFPIHNSDDLGYVVNACLKSKLHGVYVLRNGDEVDEGDIEPVDNPESEVYKYIMHYKDEILHRDYYLGLTTVGHIWQDVEDERDVVGFKIKKV